MKKQCVHRRCGLFCLWQRCCFQPAVKKRGRCLDDATEGGTRRRSDPSGGPCLFGIRGPDAKLATCQYSGQGQRLSGFVDPVRILDPSGTFMMAVPFGILGALSANWLRGLENNVYFQIGLLVLIGLRGKNAILRVTFAVDLRKQSRSIMEATIEEGEQSVIRAFSYMIKIL